MSIARAWELQVAIKARLDALLATAGPGGAAVAVVDSPPADPDRLHVRIDGSTVNPRPPKCDSTRHFWTVHVFERPSGGGTAARGQKTVKQLQALIVQGLRGWVPAVTGATAARHDSSEIVPADDGLTQHALSRFSIIMGD